MARFAVVVRSYVEIDTRSPDVAARKIRKLLEDLGGFKWLRPPRGHGGVDVLGPVGSREPWGQPGTLKHIDPRGGPPRNKGGDR